MHFLFPWMLLGSLGVSIPIAIHLLNRYRFKQVEWGAMELLRRALIIRSRRIRIEDLLLLLLRCLILLLIALALARPVLAPTSGSWLGRNADVGAVIAVDASFSMNHRPGLNSRFDRAADRVRQIAKTLKPGSLITLVLLGDRPRVLLRNTGYDADRLEGLLKEAAPFPERLNLDVCLEEVQTLLDEIKTPIKECYLVTDAQETTWKTMSERARQTLKEITKTGSLYFLPAPVEGSENTAVTRFELKAGLLRKGAIARFDVEVSNFGSRTRDNVTVSLLLNDAVVDQRVLDRVEPGQPAGVSMFVRFDKLGLARLTARIGPDELSEDNSRHLIADIRDRTRILYVRAASVENPKKDDKDYIVTALAPKPSEALSIETVSWLELPARRLSDYQIVILSNVPDLADEQLRTLWYYVKEGGGLMVFLGDNVQPALYNARLKFEGESLLPAELGESQADSNGWPIEAVKHPLSRALGSLPSDWVRDARVQRYFRMKLRADGRAAVQLTGRDEPIVAEKSLGRGRVIVFASAADRAWTNMVVEPGLYAVLLYEAVTYLGRRVHEEPVTVSGTISLPLPITSEDAGSKVIFHPLSGRALPPVAPVQRGDQFFAELPVAELPGFYNVRTEPPGPVLAAAVNVDTTESRVRPLTPDALNETLQGLDVRLVLEGDGIEAAVRNSRIGREFWRELLIAAVLLLLLEGFLARWFTRRKGTGERGA